MFFRLLLESFRRQRRRRLLAGLAILLGTTAVTAMLALATTIGDRIHAELAVYGANILITPQAASLAVNIGGVDIAPTTGNAYLHESDLAKLHTIFWANNITAVSPELPLNVSLSQQQESSGATQQHTRVPALGLWFHHPLSTTPPNAVILSTAKDPETARPAPADRTLQLQSPESHPAKDALITGAPALHPSWTIQGRWPSDDAPDEIVIGKTLQDKLQLSTTNPVEIDGKSFRITGIVSTGDIIDNNVLLPLATAQSLNGTPGAVDRIEIAARTRPEDAFARQNPDTLSPAQREIWYCRPYANSIAYQIREAIPGANAQQVRRVEQSEGNVLKRISGLMWLISAAALLSAGFAVSAAMATAVLERRAEIGLMRSLGASQARIASLFYVEAALLALFSGALGYLAGSVLAAALGAHIFAGAAPAPTFNPVLLPIIAGLALVVAIAGSTPAIRSALKLDPSSILRADA